MCYIVVKMFPERGRVAHWFLNGLPWQTVIDAIVAFGLRMSLINHVGLKKIIFGSILFFSAIVVQSKILHVISI